MKRGTILGLLGLAAGLVGGCAKERPVKPVIPNEFRLKKETFNGNFLYLKTVSSVEAPGTRYGWLAPGMYMEADRIVRFEMKEDALEVHALDPFYQNARDARANGVLASFASKHVDVLRKQNVDGDDTHEEEVTESRRVWREREYLELTTTEDAVDPFSADTVVANAASPVEVDPATGAINFTVTRRLKDDTLVTVRHSFLPYQESPGYVAKEYPRNLQKRFGFFKTSILGLDRYGRLTTAHRREVANRWDTSKKVVFHLSKDFPDHLKAHTREIFNQWNTALRSATGRDVLELRENSGQELGDLRYNLITYNPDPLPSHGILGYGPSFTNPRTGEILKADVVLYGGSLKRSLFSERLWEQLLGEDEEAPQKAPAPGNPHGRMNVADLFAAFSVAPSAETSLPRFAGRLDQDLIRMVREAAPERSLRAMREEFLKDHAKRITRLNEDLAQTINVAKHGDKAKGKTPLEDDQLEQRILSPLLGHELGHALGLRHNFIASADHKHFTAGASTSSWMDYGHMASEEPEEVGTYDTAAIEVLYGADPAKTEAALAENFLFCTDEDILSSRNFLCSQFDTGTSLTETVAGQLDRYYASWMFNNIRLDRVNFGGNTQDYVNRVIRYLLPLRLAFDNAQAILNAVESQNLMSLWYVAGQRIEADKDSRPDRVRDITITESMNVEVRPGVIEVQPRQVTRRVDLDKVPAIVQDAATARTAALQALIRVILDESQSRPLYSSGDPLSDELQVRGVLTDKLLALLFLTSRTPDPSGNGGVITMFRDFGNGAVGEFLSYLISNTTPVMNPTTRQVETRLKFYDVNLRQMALNLTWNELATLGSAASAREMFASQKVTVDMAGVESRLDLREQVAGANLLKGFFAQNREEVTRQMLEKHLAAAGLGAFPALSPLAILPSLLSIPDVLRLQEIQSVQATVDQALAEGQAELARLSAAASPEDRTVEAIESVRRRIRVKIAELMQTEDQAARGRLQGEILALEAQRNRVNVAYAQSLGSQFLKAPLSVPNAAFTPATGRLIRDNYNRLEDQRAAVLLIAQSLAERGQRELQKPEGERDQALFQSIVQNIEQLQEQARNIGDYLSSEKLLVESMYQLYNNQSGI